MYLLHNDVLKLRSINNNVTPADNTGNVITNNIAVNNTDHTNNGNLLIVIPNVLILNIVVIKFIAPNNDDIDVKCNENIAISTDGPLCDCIPDNGGYTVHPVPAPFSINALDIKHINAGGKSQKLILFKRANDISLAPIINGTK
ncbi:unnamed protein product [Pichia kudriavzevii]